MNRTEHLAWCKQRALEYLPDNPREAFTSMASDLQKHEETQGHPAIELGFMLLMTDNVPEMQNFIEGFN